MPFRNKLKVNMNIKESIKESNEFFSIADEVFDKNPIPDTDIDGNHFDNRDIKEMLYYIEQKGNTREEKIANLQKEYAKLATAFLYNNKEEKEKYLNNFHDSLKEIERLYNDGINNTKDLIGLIRSHSAGQSFATKASENKEWFYKKYNTKEKQESFYADMGLTLLALNTLSEIKEGYPELKTKKTGGSAELYNSGFDDNGMSADGLYKSYRDKTNTITLELPSYFYLRTNEDREKFAYGTNIVEKVASLFSIKDNIDYVNPECTLSYFNIGKFIFIDGRNIDEVARERKESSNVKISLACAKAQILNTALTKGDHVISIATPIVTENGLEFDIKKVRGNNEEACRKEASKYSWFRKTFFNWGPFKIYPNSKNTDKLYENSKKDDKKLIEMAKKEVEEINKKINSKEPGKINNPKLKQQAMIYNNKKIEEFINFANQVNKSSNEVIINGEETLQNALKVDTKDNSIFNDNFTKKNETNSLEKNNVKKTK